MVNQEKELFSSISRIIWQYGVCVGVGVREVPSRIGGRVIGGLVGASVIFFCAGIFFSGGVADRGLFDVFLGVCGRVGSSVVILKCVRHNGIPCMI